MNASPEFAASFGRRLRYLRRLKNISQAELAGKIDLGVKQVGRLERGESTPFFATLEKLALALGTEPASFFLHLETSEADAIERSTRDVPGTDIQPGALTRPAVWIMSPCRGHSVWSDDFYRLLGHPPGSVRPGTQTFLRHVDKIDQNAVAEFFDRVREGRPGDIQIRVHIPSGIHRLLMLSAQSLKLDHDTQPTTQIIARDFTEYQSMRSMFKTNLLQIEDYAARKNVELLAALTRYAHENEQRKKIEQREHVFELMVQHSRDGKLFIDCRGMIREANPACNRLIDLPASDLLKQHYSHFFTHLFGPSFVGAAIDERVKKALEHGRESSWESWVDIPGKGRDFIRITCIPAGYDHETLGAVITIHDLTDLMLAQNKLVQSQKRLRKKSLELNSFFSASQDLMGICRKDGFMLRINAAWEWTFGYKRSELEGSKILHLVHPSDVHATQKLFKADSEKIFYTSLINRIRQSNNEYRTIEWNIQKIEEFIYFIGRDITDRKKSEHLLLLKDSLLELAASCMLKLLSDNGSSDVISHILAQLGKTTQTDRVYVFKNRVDERSGSVLTSQIHEWARPGIPSQKDNPDLQDAPYDDIFPRWHQMMQKGSTIKGHVRDFPENERMALEPQNIQSLLAVPIHVHGTFWGFLGLDAVRHQREWSSAEEFTLSILAAAIGTAEMRLQAETTIREQHDFQHGLFQTLPAGVAVLTKEGQLMQLNEGFTQLTGYSSQDLGTVTDWYLLAYPDPLLRQEVLSDWNRYFPGENIVREYPVTCRNGAVKDVEFRWVHLPNEISIVILMDITARKRAEQELKIKDFALNSSLNGVAITDLAGRVTYANPAFMNLWGLSRCGQALGRPARSFWIDSAEADQAFDCTLMVNDLVRRMVAQRDDGTTFPVLSSSNVIFNDYRQPTGVVAFFRDMTRLEQTEDSLKAIYERVAEGVILHDDQGTILAANPYICTLLGYTEEELCGRNAVDLVPEAEKQQVQNDFASLAQDESLCTEHLLQTQSGGYIVTEIYAKRLHSNLVVGMHRDITTRKQEEQEKKDAHRILRHDLKGMINTVINLTRLIRDEAQLAKRQRDILDFIEGSGHSMREVMDTYMRIFTNEENAYEVRLKPLDLVQYTANALENHSRLADSKKVRVDFGVPETSQGKSPNTTILADPTLCRMILNNLILNALEAVPSDGTLAIRIVPEKERVRITLRNEGSVPGDIRPRFGEKYATSKEFGTGLGVYSAKVMTKIQNGTFTWRSDDSSTTIELTFQAASQETAPKQRSPD